MRPLLDWLRVSVERDTEVEPLLSAHPTPEEIRRQLLLVAERVKVMGAGKAAEQLRDIAEHLRPPNFEGIVSELAHPQMWPTREHALFLAGRITDAIRIIRRLRDDAEITGSTATITEADEWLRSVGAKIHEIPALPPPEPPKLEDLEEQEDP